MSEGFNYISDYLLSELEEVNDSFNDVKNRKNSLELEIREIATKLNQMKGNIDFAHEAFSPISDKNNFLNDEIGRLNLKQEELLIELEEVQAEKEKYKIKLNKLEEILKRVDKEYTDDEFQEKVNEISCSRLIKEQEIVRQRIAGDLHDTVVQMLTGLIHKIEFCTKVIDADPIRVKLEMQLINSTIRESINELRDIIYDLRPMTFDDFGFDETLNRAIEKMSRDSDISMEFDIEGNSYELDQMTSISLYRIMLEACINSIKHSNAKKVMIKLVYSENQVSLSVKDDGDGFNIDKCHNNEFGEQDRKGFGLMIMRERTLLLSGKFKIDSETNRGTEVFVIIPTKEDKGRINEN